MLNIAVCDDEQRITAELEQTLIEIFDNLNIDAEIDVYFNADKLYRNMNAGTHYDLIFLDIEFAESEINGVEVGRLIRNVHNNNTTAIVFISWEKKYSLQLFDIQPLNFLIKPLKRDKIEQVIKTYLSVAGIRSRLFTYKIGHDICKVQIIDIICLESRDRKLILYLSDGSTSEFYGSLKKVYKEQLQKLDFLFIHASYVVNFDYITKIKYNQLILSDSAPLPISPSRRTEVRERYLAIMKRRRV